MKFESAECWLKRKGLMVENEAGTVNLSPGVAIMVRCTDCGMTMPCLSAFIEVNSEETYCGSCADAHLEAQKTSPNYCKTCDCTIGSGDCPECKAEAAQMELEGKEEAAWEKRMGIEDD